MEGGRAIENSKLRQTSCLKWPDLATTQRQPLDQIAGDFYDGESSDANVTRRDSMTIIKCVWDGA